MSAFSELNRLNRWPFPQKLDFWQNKKSHLDRIKKLAMNSNVFTSLFCLNSKLRMMCFFTGSVNCQVNPGYLPRILATVINLFPAMQIILNDFFFLSPSLSHPEQTVTTVLALSPIQQKSKFSTAVNLTISLWRSKLLPNKAIAFSFKMFGLFPRRLKENLLELFFEKRISATPHHCPQPFVVSCSLFKTKWMRE